MGPAWDTAKDGIMSEEDYPYERKVLFDISIYADIFVSSETSGVQCKIKYSIFSAFWTKENIAYSLKEGECRYNSSQAVASVTGHET